MKIAMVVASLSRSGGGVSAVVEALSATIEMMPDMRVHVFGLDEDAWISGDSMRWRGAPTTIVRVVGPRSFGYAPALTRGLIEWAPDVVHAHGIWMHPSRSVLHWARHTRRPYIVSPHGMLDPWAIQHSRIKKRVAKILYEGAHLSHAAALHALTMSEASAIRAYGLDNPLAIVPNGVSMPDGKADMRAPWSDRIDNSMRVMLYLGRLHPKKNLQVLLNAWAEARARIGATMKWHLIIAGWDQDRHEAQLRDSVKRLGLEAGVSFLGPLFGSEKMAALDAADAFVLPSISEGLPVSVLEAWAHGLPVLMTTACNLPQGFSSGAAWCLPLEISGMIEMLCEVMQKPKEELEATGLMGRQLVANEFTWNDVAEKMVHVYCEAIARSMRPNGGPSGSLS